MSESLNLQRINFNHLYYFYIVAIEGSIKSTAEKLHVSQPTISDQIKLLEEFLDQKLFIRSNRSLTLSEAGKTALDYCHKIFKMSDEMIINLQRKNDSTKQSIDIGMTSFMGQYFSHEDIIPLFDMNDYQINFHEDKRHLLIAALEAKKIDILFTDSKENLNSNHHVYFWGKNKTFAIAHKNLLRKVNKKFPEMLNEIPYIHHSESTTLDNEIELYFSRYQIIPKTVGRATNLNLVELVVQNGTAACIVPEVIKDKICSKNKNIISIGELTDLESSVFAVVRSSYDGPLRKILLD